VFTVVAAVAHLGREELPWIVAALPLYDGIEAAGDPDRIADLAAVRRRFNEARWTSWNLLRVVTSTVAFGVLAWALVLYGRSS
jgi:uncharacterized membrane protein